MKILQYALAVAVVGALSGGLTLAACRRPSEPAQSVPDASAALRPAPRAAFSADAAPPTPTLSPCIFSGPFTLVANWDFGTQGNVRDEYGMTDAGLSSVDNFGTIANGTNLGAVTVAFDGVAPIHVSALLNQPGNLQPVENPSAPTRVFTPTTMVMNVASLFDAAAVWPAEHNAGCGSFYALGVLDAGGAFLDADVVWETRIRMNNPVLYYYYATWSDGNVWNNGAELDTPETFGALTSFPDAAIYFHVNSVGGQDKFSYTPGWQNGMTQAGIPGPALDLTQFHVWTLVYRRDNTYVDYVDTYLTNKGFIYWTGDAGPNTPPVNMTFLFDCSWGNVSNPSVNPGEDAAVPAADMSYSCEIDYSRVWVH